MKKSVSLGFMSIFSTTVMTGMIISGMNDLSKNNNKNLKHKQLNSMNQVVSNQLSADEQKNSILNTVTQKTFLGDINEATNHGDLTSIDVSKLIDLDNANGKITPAYLKIDGKFTSDINEAKRSHVQNPIIKYLDTEGNIYDTEIEAYNAMIINEENYSNGIAYYEIQDLSNSKKPTYKINPLNKKDVEKLKEIAYANVGINGSRFDVMRLKSDGTKFNKNDFSGISDLFLNNKVNDLVNQLIQVVYDNSLFSIINSYVHYEWVFGFGNKAFTTELYRDYYGVSDSALTNLYNESVKDLNRFSSNSKFESFKLSVSQQTFECYDMVKKSNEAYNIAYNKVMASFNNNPDKKAVAEKVANMVKSVVGKNFLGGSRISTDFRKSYDEAKKILKGKVLDALKNQFSIAFNNSQTGFSSINEYLTSNMRDVFQENYNKNINNVKYAITYNGSPLFLVNDSIMTNIKDQEDFRMSPTSGIKNYLTNEVRKNGNWREQAKNGLVNISNTYNYDINKNLVLTKENLLTNYNTNNKHSNFQFKNSNTTNSFGQDVKLIDEDIYSKNNIYKGDLEKQLNRRKDDDKSLLNSPYGTIEAIYQYNKTLTKLMQMKDPSQTLINNVNNQRIIDTNDVVFLYSGDKTPATIKYGKYANYGTKFNVSLTDDSNRVISSTEELASEFQLENLGIPTKQYNFYDYSGKLISSELINSVNGDFSESEKNAWENTLKKIDVQADQEYVFYKETDKETLVKNQITKLYVCYISNDNTSLFSNYSSYKLRAESTTGTYYGFTSYDELKGFVNTYVDTVNTILPPIITPVPPVTSSNGFYRDVIIGSWSSLGLIVALAGFTGLYFYNFSNNKNKTKKVKDNRNNVWWNNNSIVLNKQGVFYGKKYVTTK